MEDTTSEALSVDQAASLLNKLSVPVKAGAEDQRVPETKPEQQPDTAAEQAPAAADEETPDSEPATDEGAEASADEKTDDETPQPRLFTVKVDGKDVQVTEAELLKGYSFTAHNTQRSQKIAEQERAFQAEQAAVRAERQEMQAALAQLYAHQKASSQPEPSLATSATPEQFAVDWTMWKQGQDNLAKIAAEQARLKEKEDADARAGFAQHVRDERAKLLEALPELHDPVKDAEISKNVYEYALSQGYTHEQFEATTDHRMLLMAYKAMQYDKGRSTAAATKAKIENKIENALAPSQPGSRTAAKPQNRFADAKARAKQSGREEDAAAALALLG